MRIPAASAPILYRGSLSEMVVPYGDPSGGWFFRNSFDAGELGLGLNAASLKPGVDCPENCTVFDAVFADSEGRPVPVPRAIALYERDGGIAWKHDEEARRARDLVLGFVATVGNYDYGFDWIFHQNGSLEMRVALTGVMAAKAVADGAHDPYSHMVGKNLAAPHHQHFFTFRLDLDVDGPSPNRVVEMNSVPGAYRSREPVWRRLSDGGDGTAHGKRGAAQPEPRHQPQMDRDQPGCAQPARPRHRLRAATRRKRGPVRAAR